MNILICGADGFLGRAIANHLINAGHTLVRGVHHPRHPGDIAIDYRQDMTAQDWLPRINGIDAVVNAVGILNETQAEDFSRIHHRAPTALFQACARMEIKKVIQISALGGPCMTPYLQSKYAADKALLETMPMNSVVLRPTLIFGQEGASTRFFMTLASLPVLAIPQGAGKVQPVHVDDVASTVAALLVPQTAPTPASIVDLPGPRAMDYAEWMENYRQLMRLRPVFHLPIPALLMRATARLAGLFPRSFLSRDTWTMLTQGNCADAGTATTLLGRPLRDPVEFAPTQDAEELRLKAFAGWRRPLNLGVLATIWLLTALVSAGLFPIEQSQSLLAPFGLTGTTAQAVLALAVGLDTLMGVLTLLKPGRQLWLFQIALIAGYTALVAVYLPEFLLHPFGPILKNLAVAALLIQLFAEENTL